MRANGTRWRVARPATIVVALVGLLAAFVGIASPANGYDNSLLNYRWASPIDVDPGDDCHPGLHWRITVVPVSGGCFIDDDADNTFFRHDSGGGAYKCEINKGDELVAKTEFHPYDERLFVYDNENDGDTIYVRLRVGGDTPFPFFLGPYSPPGTSAEDEFTLKNFDLAEGLDIEVQVFDNAGPSDRLDCHGAQARS